MKIISRKNADGSENLNYEKELANEVKSLKTNSPLVFAGSFVSVWHPSGLANGISVTDSIRKIIFKGFDMSKEEADLLESLAKWFPFEHLFELCPNKEKANSWLIETYNCSVANPVHKAIVKAFSKDDVSHIITTNYDKCFEDALKQYKSLKYKEVVNEEQAVIDYTDKTSKFYYKIHGTAELGENLIFTLRQEGFLEDGKRILLKNLMSDRVCLFVGYSGYDFDLCPIIAKIPNIKIVWIDIKPSPASPNAKKLLNDTNGTYIEANMLDMIPLWLGSKCDTTYSVKDVTSDEIEGLFTESEIALWRMELLNAIGLPKLAKKATFLAKGKVDEKSRIWQEARAIFNEGKYLAASNTFVTLSRAYENDKNFKKASDTWFDTSDSFRAGGYFLRSFWSLYRGRKISDDYDKGKYFLKKSIIIFNFLEGVSSNRLSIWLSPIVRSWLKRNLQICLKVALKQGSLLDFQQVGLLASRADISLKTLEVDEYYAPPEPKDGYEHLGYYIAQAMTFMDECRRTDYKSLTETERKELFEKIDKHIQTCEIIEQFSSIWKFLAVKRTFVEQIEGKEFSEIEKLKKYFQECEYSKITKLQIIKKFDTLKK